tara:strand:- start:968 stop:1903 length:936 start_codon:yes stop_codon:yes gene_type:complete
MSSETYKCKVCGAEFDSQRALHAHIKSHGLYLADYYCKYYPRYNLLTGEQLPFKNKEDYFVKSFSNRKELDVWAKTAKREEVSSYILKQLKNRIESKQLSRGPSYLELELYNLPSIDLYKSFFGSYSKACAEAGVKPLFYKNITEDFFTDDASLSDVEIVVDTREQKPLDFVNPKVMKLDFGDYTTTGENYTKTFVDRKSESDFKSTMSTGFKRFTKELERARDFNSYMYIVTESSIEKIKRNNNYSSHKSKLDYIWHNMRVLSHEFADTCQFVFSGDRNASKKIILKLLVNGDNLWNTDIQYFIDKQNEL